MYGHIGRSSVQTQDVVVSAPVINMFQANNSALRAEVTVPQPSPVEGADLIELQVFGAFAADDPFTTTKGSELQAMADALGAQSKLVNITNADAGVVKTLMFNIPAEKLGQKFWCVAVVKDSLA